MKLFRSILLVVIFSGVLLSVGYSEEDSGTGVCFALYTVSNNVLKMSAQFYPLGAGDERVVYLEVERKGKWRRRWAFVR